MKRLVLGFFASCSLVMGQVEPGELTDLDVEELLERLDDLEEGAGGRQAIRLGAAKAALSSALKNEAAAWDLYTNCVEKVQFIDQGRPPQAFREWKRNAKDRLGPQFPLLLRHQLNWLLMGIEVAGAAEVTPAMSAKGIERLDQLVKDLPDMSAHENALREENVMKSAFAKSYGLDALALENWPGEPLKIEEVYNNFILPPLRNPKSLAALKTAWTKRIEQEGFIAIPGAAAKGVRDEVREARRKVFLEEKRPQLLWDMEVDLFKAGDQRGAAVRMVEHIKKNHGHKNEGKWIGEFKELIGAGEEEEQGGEV